MWWETKIGRRLQPERRQLSHWLAYGLPVLTATAVVLVFYARSIYHFPELWTGTTLPDYRAPWSAHSGFRPKHVYNMCQVYAFGYQQRRPEWPGNPMLNCSGLMASTFGTPLPSLVEMLRGNPVATLEHFWWNIKLAPSGIQLLLFNASTGGVNPDYFPVELNSPLAAILSVIIGSILARGAFLLYRGRGFWWEYWLRDRAWGWLGMMSVVAVAGPVILTQRPRPSYLFCQGLVLMALAGMCVFAICRRWSIGRNLRRWFPIVTVALLMVVPPYRDGRDRPLLTLYERLAPFGAIFHHPDSVFVVSSHPIEIHDYVGHNYFTSPLLHFDYTWLEGTVADRPLPPSLDRLGVNLVYIDEALWGRLWANPVHRPFLTSPESAGWRLLRSQNVEGGKWMLMQKR